MTPDERRQLARTLAAIDRPHPLIDPRLRRRRRFGLLFMTACCLGLAAWIAILILTLPDALHLARLARPSGWGSTSPNWPASPRPPGRPGTSARSSSSSWSSPARCWSATRGSTSRSPMARAASLMSLVSALVVELPLAVLLFTSARRLVRVTIQTMMQLSGIAGPVPPLWRIPLFADGLEEALPARLRPRSRSARAHVASDVTAAEGSSSLGIRRFLGSGDPEGRTVDTSQYAQYRPLMFSIAYRMTGSVSDAEDIVQEAFLRRPGRQGRRRGCPGRVAQGVPGHHHHPAGHRPPALGPRPPRVLRRHLAARAAHRGHASLTRPNSP